MHDITLHYTRHQLFELLDQDGVLLNDALEERTLLQQAVSTFDSLVPTNVVEVG
jgi:hypothetical protein